MSPARHHRDRHAALGPGAIPAQPIASREEGGRTPPADHLDSASLTPARQHRLHRAAASMAAQDAGAPAPAPAPDSAGAQTMLRLVHDLRRLKEIQSIERKIEAKRAMIPEYRPWIEGLLAAARETGKAARDEILPTIMIWLIDTGQYGEALPLISHVLDYDIPLPARYARTAPALIVEEIAGAALKDQLAGHSFPLEILVAVDALTVEHDMHDEIRAKMQKAIGFEYARLAEAMDPAAPGFAAAIETALQPLRRAQQLNDRAGAKDRIKRLEKLLAPARGASAATEPAGTAG